MADPDLEPSRGDRRDDNARDADERRGDRLYDSAERREDLAASLEGIGDAEAAEARMVADTHQGRPASEAVAQRPSQRTQTRAAQRRPTRVRARQPSQGR